MSDQTPAEIVTRGFGAKIVVSPCRLSGKKQAWSSAKRQQQAATPVGVTAWPRIGTGATG